MLPVILSWFFPHSFSNKPFVPEIKNDQNSFNLVNYYGMESDLEDDFEIIDPKPVKKTIATSSGSVSSKGDLKRTVRFLICHH
jgi:hypothetical protein